MSDPIPALRRQLEQLEERRASGELDASSYARDKSRLERELVDRVMAADRPKASAAGAPTARISGRMAALLATAVAVFAVAGYSITGSPNLIFGAPPQAQAGGAHEVDGAQFAAAVEKLAQKLEEQPDNFEGWALLAHSYAQMGRFADAVRAYGKAAALDGNDARLLVDYADALAVVNDRNLDGEPMKLIERALAIDPGNAKALALAGTAAFNRKDYKAAVQAWERLAAVAPADSPFQRQVQDSIAEARELGGLGPAAARPAAAAPALATATATASAADGGRAVAAGSAVVTGTVRLAPTLLAQTRPEDTVFVFARAAEGPRMPLAIVRKQVRDLPFAFTLSDEMAMAPQARLSLHPKVVIDARVSRSGQAQPAAGDLAGRSATVANNARDVVVEIDDVVKN